METAVFIANDTLKEIASCGTMDFLNKIERYCDDLLGTQGSLGVGECTLWIASVPHVPPTERSQSLPPCHDLSPIIST